MAIWHISESLALTISVTKISLDYQQQSQPDIWSCTFKSSVIIHFLKNLFLIRSINTEKFAFALPNARLASPLLITLPVTDCFL